MRIFNLTKHKLTAEQQADATCVDVPAAQAAELQDFVTPPTYEEMQTRAAKMMKLAKDAGAKENDHVLLASAMYFIPFLVVAAMDDDLIPTFSFTKRVSKETEMSDGSIKQEYIFRHEQWITVPDSLLTPF